MRAVETLAVSLRTVNGTCWVSVAFFIFCLINAPMSTDDRGPLARLSLSLSLSLCRYLSISLFLTLNLAVTHHILQSRPER